MSFWDMINGKASHFLNGMLLFTLINKRKQVYEDKSRITNQIALIDVLWQVYVQAM